MTNWMLRGLVFGAAMVVVRLFQGTLIDVWQTQAGLISIMLLLLFLAGVVAWGVIDGRADAAANPDPDRRSDLAMTWLLAGLVAGLLSGAVTWLVSVFYKSLYVGGLINELTTFSAFSALGPGRRRGWRVAAGTSGGGRDGRTRRVRGADGLQRRSGRDHRGRQPGSQRGADRKDSRAAAAQHGNDRGDPGPRNRRAHRGGRDEGWPGADRADGQTGRRSAVEAGQIAQG
jgi:hypothetical protein